MWMPLASHASGDKLQTTYKRDEGARWNSKGSTKFLQLISKRSWTTEPNTDSLLTIRNINLNVVPEEKSGQEMIRIYPLGTMSVMSSQIFCESIQ